jgi:hypothetical protein
MDFISLATEQHRFQRFLDEMLGEDDPTVVGGRGVDTTTSSEMSAPERGVALPSIDSPSSQSIDTEVRPIFSHNAEMELYQLATNFLLYVALVIVVILVCRIYFPEWLIARKPAVPVRRSSNYNYRVAEEQDELFDEEDEDGDDEEELLSSSTSNKGGVVYEKQPSFLEFQQERLSRKQVLQRLAFCSIFLNVTFVVWGALQVRDSFRLWH